MTDMATELFSDISFQLPLRDKLVTAREIGQRCGALWFRENPEHLPSGYPDELADWSRACRYAWRSGLVAGWHATRDQLYTPTHRNTIAMTDETRAAQFDFSTMSDAELEALLPAIEKEVEKRKDSKRREALEKIRVIARDVGMTPEELLGVGDASESTSRRLRGAGRRGPIVWQHPDDPDKVYRGGKKPDWLVALEQEGKKAVKVG